MKACRSTGKVRRFLGAYVLYNIWIFYHAHIAKPFYWLLKKEKKFAWNEEQELTIDKLKVVLKLLLILTQVDYNYGRPMIVIIYISPIAIEWTIGQDNKEDNQFVIRFEARILTEKQRAYLQVKNELGMYLPH